MRVVALIASYNERRFIAPCLEHLHAQGVESTFIPSREQPDHDHPEFPSTLRTYYPFCPSFPHQLKAWKAADAPRPNLVSSGGHRVAFRSLRMHPESFPMKHYLFLSVSHAVEKYVERQYDPAEVRRGWHGWRAGLRAEDIRLPGESELRIAAPGEELDVSQSRQRHFIDDPLQAAERG